MHGTKLYNSLSVTIYYLCPNLLTPSVSKYVLLLIFFTTLIIRLIQKIMQVQFTLLAICFIGVCILILTYRFTCLP
jgi:hypothetical protein